MNTISYVELQEEVKRLNASIAKRKVKMEQAFIGVCVCLSSLIASCAGVAYWIWDTFL